MAEPTMKLRALVPLVALLSCLPYCSWGEENPAADCVAPSRLSCELLLNPSATVIYDPRPEFAWACGSGDEAFRQTAYQIVVREASGEKSIVWDSKRVESRESLNVEYAGKPLQPGQRKQWLSDLPAALEKAGARNGPSLIEIHQTKTAGATA